MNIAIWGTGTFGKYIEHQLRSNGAYSIRYFVDSSKSVSGQKINGREIISPERLQEIYADELDFVLVAFLNGIEIYRLLSKMNIGRFGIIWNRVLEAGMQLADDLTLDRNIVWNDAEYLGGPVLRSLETNIVDGCNLNCKGCSHFSNLFDRDTRVPFEVYCKDLKHITEHAHIHQFNMLGGEVLLNPRITEYIEYARKRMPYSDIELITNGLLLPRQTETFFRCCAENDVTISISGYPPTLRLKDRITEIMDKYGIVYIFREDVKEFGKNLDLSGSMDQCEAVKKCRGSRCAFLRYGKIYKCPFEALGNHFFDHFNLDISLQGGIDIWDENLDWSMLAERFMQPYEPVDACRYCGEEVRIAWEAAKEPALEDWVVNKGV